VIRVAAEGREPEHTTVGEVSTKELVTVSPDDDLEEAMKLLAEHQVRRLPVVEGDRLVGILAQADIARVGMDAKTGEVVEEISRLARKLGVPDRGGPSGPAPTRS
jgi:predicted transcriptional regulator